MSRVCAVAALFRRVFSFKGLSPRDVRSWLTRQSAESARAAVDAWAIGTSAEEQTVAAEAGEAPAATARRRRGRMVPRWAKVRIYPTVSGRYIPDLYGPGRMY